MSSYSFIKKGEINTTAVNNQTIINPVVGNTHTITVKIKNKPGVVSDQSSLSSPAKDQQKHQQQQQLQEQIMINSDMNIINNNNIQNHQQNTQNNKHSNDIDDDLSSAMDDGGGRDEIDYLNISSSPTYLGIDVNSAPTSPSIKKHQQISGEQKEDDFMDYDNETNDYIDLYDDNNNIDDDTMTTTLPSPSPLPLLHINIDDNNKKNNDDNDDEMILSSFSSSSLNVESPIHSTSLKGTPSRKRLEIMAARENDQYYAMQI